MRGFKEQQGKSTRLVFDAMKGQFIDTRVLGPFDAPPPHLAEVIEFGTPAADATPSPRSMRPMRQRAG
jgi:hypothetical protein